MVTVDDDDERKNNGLDNMEELQSGNPSSSTPTMDRELFQSHLREMYINHRYRLDTYGRKGALVSLPSVLPLDVLCVLKFRIYHPSKSRCVEENAQNDMKYFCEITVLNSNTLEDFRDWISCNAGEGLSRQTSNPRTRSKGKYPSSFFYIENVFYSDYRHKKKINFRKVVRKWKGDYVIKKGCMNNTFFDDLDLRFGYPYVYQHHGRCEHLFKLVDGWILNTNDQMETAKYPSCVCTSKRCNNCGIQRVHWNCSDMECYPPPSDPILLCEMCYITYNSVAKKKIRNSHA